MIVISHACFVGTFRGPLFRGPLIISLSVLIDIAFLA